MGNAHLSSLDGQYAQLSQKLKEQSYLVEARPLRPARCKSLIFARSTSYLSIFMTVPIFHTAQLKWMNAKVNRNKARLCLINPIQLYTTYDIFKSTVIDKAHVDLPMNLPYSTGNRKCLNG